MASYARAPNCAPIDGILLRGLLTGSLFTGSILVMLVARTNNKSSFTRPFLSFFLSFLCPTAGLDPAQQLAAICRFACKRGYTVRAIGTGSSWSRLTSTRDILINMTSLKQMITPRPANRRENLLKEYVDIEVQGGMTVVDFVEKLDKHYGLALPTMGNYAGQTVAGVASTSTHGSGYFAGTLVSTSP